MINIQEALSTLGVLEINAGSSTGQTSYKSDNIIHSYSPVDGKLIGSVSITTEEEYEKMCNEIPNVHILATNEEMVAHMRIAGWEAPIYNISGLSFGKEEVQSRVQQKPFIERKHRVVFGARWDQEKQPQFFMDLHELELLNFNLSIIF